MEERLKALEEQIAEQAAQITELENRLENVSSYAYATMDRLSERCESLRSELHEEQRRRESEDYHLESQVRNAERAAENAQRTADSAYSSARNAGGGYGW